MHMHACMQNARARTHTHDHAVCMGVWQRSPLKDIMHGFDDILQGVEHQMLEERRKLLNDLHDTFFIQDNKCLQNVADYITETMGVRMCEALDILAGSGKYIKVRA